MRQQLDFLQTKNLGFNKEAALVIPTNLGGPDGRAAAERFREALASDTRVKNVAASSFNIGDGWSVGKFEKIFDFLKQAFLMRKSIIQTLLSLIVYLKNDPPLITLS